MAKESRSKHYQGIINPRFNRWVRKNTSPEGYPPDVYPMTVKVPLDIAVLFFRRFESHPLVDKSTNAEIKPGDLVAHLMWAYGNAFAIGDQANVFEPFYKGIIRERQRKGKGDGPPKKPKALKDPDEKRGRKPKRQLNLFTGPQAALAAQVPGDQVENLESAENGPDAAVEPKNNGADLTQGGASEGSSLKP